MPYFSGKCSIAMEIPYLFMSYIKIAENQL